MLRSYVASSAAARLKKPGKECVEVPCLVSWLTFVGTGGGVSGTSPLTFPGAVVPRWLFIDIAGSSWCNLIETVMKAEGGWKLGG